MSKSMTAGAQKFMENYLESSSDKSALYDEDMNLVWSNYHLFFDNFDLKQVKIDTQLTSETALSVIADGIRVVLNITPVYRSTRIVCAYVCVIKEAYDIYNLMSKSIISDFSNNLADKNRFKIEKLAFLNKQIEEAVIELKGNNVKNKKFDRLSELVKEQDSLIISVFDEAKFCIDTCCDQLSENKELCNLTLMFATVFSYIEKDFKELKRKISVSVPEKDYYLAKSGEMLLLAFLHLLRSHMTLSPLKSSVLLSAEHNADISSGGSFVVKIKTSLLPKEKIDENKLVTARAYREFAKKVIKFNYDGNFECADSQKNMQTVISVPVAKKSRGVVLSSSDVRYNIEGNIYHSYMREILQRENEELADNSDK